MSYILEFLGSIAQGLLRMFTRLGFMLLAIKGMILTALTVVLTTVLYTLFGTIIEEVFNWVKTYIENSANGFPDLAYQFIGLGAWLFDHLRLEESLALVFAGITISFVLRLVRIKR